MTVHLAADVGNSRIKWGVCAREKGESAVVGRASLGDDVEEWQEQLARWTEQFPLLKGDGALTWAAAGVDPERCGRLCDWIIARGDRVVRIDRYDQLPLALDVDEPERVGLDRLLNAVAAKSKLPAGRPAVLVDVGSAVTVDSLDERHVFRGGAIFPGVRLMAKALHDYTALLPAVEVGPPAPALPGRSTVPAIQAGVFWTVLGGIEMIARRLHPADARAPHLYLTGGDAEWIVAALAEMDPPPWLADYSKTLWPEQTLQGLLWSAEALATVPL